MPIHFVLVDFENVQPRNLVALAGKRVQVKVFVGASQAKVPFELARALQALGPDAEYIQADGSGRNALDFHIAYYLGELAAKHPGASFQIVSKDTGFDPLLRHLRKQGIECHRAKAIGEVANGTPEPAPAASVAPERPRPTPRDRAPAATPAAIPATSKRGAPGKARTGRSATPQAAAIAPASVRAPAPAARAVAAVDPARVALVIANLAKRRTAKPRTLKSLSGAIQSLFAQRLSDAELQALLAELQRRSAISVSGASVGYPAAPASGSKRS